MGSSMVFSKQNVSEEQYMTALTLSEAGLYIEKVCSRRSNPQLMKRSFLTSARDYCQRFGTFKQWSTIEMTNRLLADWRFNNTSHLTRKEICSLGTFMPTTSDEAKALVISLVRV